MLRPSTPPSLSTDANVEGAVDSELFPAMLVSQILPIAQCEAAEARILSRWSRDILQILKAMVWYWEQEEFGKCWSCLGRIEQETLELATFRKSWAPDATTSSVSELPSTAALEEIQLALERRGVLWRQALLAETEKACPVSMHSSKGVREIQRLCDLTKEVETYFLDEKTVSETGEQIGSLWCDYLDTQSFLVELEACRQMISGSNRRVSIPEPAIPATMLVSFCDRANVILSRLDERELTEEQIAYLRAPVVVAWKEELSRWSADTVPPGSLLRELERFEKNGGMNDMENLFRTATRLLFSKTETYRHLGMMTHEIYGGPNVKIYVSKALVNHLLPPSEPEVAAFREVIQGQPVVGRREADLAIEMNFVPDPERLLLSLDVKGSISTQSRASAFATTLFNRGQADCTARKRIELTEEGFLLSPTVAHVENNRLQLRNLQTDFDGIPLVSNLFRGVVRNQYEARQGGAREETRRKIMRQIKTRVDREADGRFGEFNDKFRGFMSNSMTEFDLFLEKKNAGTEEHWLLTSWAIRSQDSLSGNTPAPETQHGAFADIKVHESALNAILGKLDIDGKSTTVGELRQMIAERFQRPELAEPGENDDIPITFAPYNPLTIRFTDGRIEISIAIDSLRIQGKTHRDFKVLVGYRPAAAPDGKLVLQRDPVISLVNAQMRSQFALRAVFGKIFPEKRPFSLTPKLLETDPRFHSLTTGHCRIEKGWFAIALVGNESSDVPLVSDRAPTRRPRR